MKTRTKMIISLGLLAAPLALRAGSLEQTYLESYRGRTGVPVPTSVVSPIVGVEHNGTVVELEFTVNERGRTEGFVVRAPADAELRDQLTRAIAKWRFEPLRENGKPVPTRVKLPVRIVSES